MKRIEYPLQIDRRIGSADLEQYIADLGIPYNLATLNSGDYAIIGNYEDASGPTLINVGIERKRIDDLVQSIEENRYTGFQMHNMAAEYNVKYLVVEGMYRLGPDNTIERVVGDRNAYVPVLNKAMTWTRLCGQLTHIQQTGVHLIQTNTAYETAVWLRVLWNWWGKLWEEHECQLIYTPLSLDGTARTSQGPLRYRDLAGPQKLCWAAAQQLPGVMSKAAECVVRFRTAQRMFNANLEDFEQIVGKGVRAKRIIEVIRG